MKQESCSHVAASWACRPGSRQQLSLQPTASAGLLDKAQTSAHSVNGHDYQVQCDIDELLMCVTLAYADSGIERLAKCGLSTAGFCV